MRCAKCGVDQPEEQFSWRFKSKGVRQAACKTCHRKISSAWYRANRQKHMQHVKAGCRKVAAWLKEYKLSLACTQCGENHPGCLDFHHRDREQKDGPIAQAAWQGWSVARILAEMAKCDVLCSNCHRKLHYEGP